MFVERGSLASLASTSFIILLLILLTAVPLSILVALDSSASHGAHSYESQGWMRESAKWDHPHRRFLVSFMEGGIAQIPLPADALGGPNLQEIVVVKDADLAANASLGISVDLLRNRLLVVVADVLGSLLQRSASSSFFIRSSSAYISNSDPNSRREFTERRRQDSTNRRGE